MMTDRLDPTTLRALGKRVEAGESGREIDEAAALAVGWQRITKRRTQEVTGWVDPDHLYCADIPPLTTSLDAVEALRMRVLPSNPLCIIWDDGLCTAVQGQRWEGDAVFPIDATAPTETAARLAALLYALAAKVEGHGFVADHHADKYDAGERPDYSETPTFGENG